MNALPSPPAARVARSVLAAALLAAGSTAGSTAGIAAAADPDRVRFNRDVRPILSENCFYCHGQDPNHRMADLRLDQREAAVDYGAIAPGDAQASVLIERILSDDPDMQMPPPDSNRRLSEAQKDLLRRWVAEGAEYEPHWAYAAAERPAVPAVDGEVGEVHNAIDAFIAAKLAERDLEPGEPADRRTLIRRVYLDLIGLLPTPAEVEAFESSADPDAYDALVDRLLARPEYGQRMSLPWLDAARYADSNGFQQDGDTFQWVWRDWVVDALNAGMPFDRFSIEQLAGDLLPEATTSQKIASAFNRNHLLNGEGGAIAEEQRHVILFDRVDTTATNWMGLTVACAQCHDHKYDPITQRDYYSLMSMFNRVSENGLAPFASGPHRIAEPHLELMSDEHRASLAAREEQIAAIEAGDAYKELRKSSYEAFRGELSADAEGPPGRLKELLAADPASLDDAKKAELEAAAEKHFAEKLWPKKEADSPQLAELAALRREVKQYRSERIERVMVMNDDRPRDTFVLARGDYLSPGEKVEFATPAFLPTPPAGSPPNRLTFARWLFDPDNPLTARVAINRMWQHFFGVGLVKTAEDFGVQSEMPLHRELLDYLAVEFREGGWDVKRMHRLIVTSAAYRRSSQIDREAYETDAENKLLARGPRFRAPAMVLRDVALQTAGLLESRVGGMPVYPYQPENVWEPLAITKERDFTYPASHGADLYRRSLYTFWRRTIGPANMFDAASRQTCSVRAAITSTPLHALTTLNDPTWVEAARLLAERLLADRGDCEAAVAAAFERILCRPPDAAELELLGRALARQRTHFQFAEEAAAGFLAVGEFPAGKASRGAALEPADHAAVAAVVLMIFNLDEAVTRE